MKKNRLVLANKKKNVLIKHDCIPQSCAHSLACAYTVTSVTSAILWYGEKSVKKKNNSFLENKSRRLLQRGKIVDHQCKVANNWPEKSRVFQQVLLLAITDCEILESN